MQVNASYMRVVCRCPKKENKNCNRVVTRMLSPIELKHVVSSIDKEIETISCLSD